MFDKIKQASARLGPDKLKRAAAALRNYGVREFLRRGTAKLRGRNPVPGEGAQRLVVTNESYHPSGTRGFECRQEVSFVTAPSKDNITQLEIRTACGSQDADSRVHLEIRDGDETIVSGSTGAIANGSDTVIRFPVVRGVFGRPLRFTVRATGAGNGVLVHPHRVKDGFTVDGGGSVACRLYGLDDEDPYQEWISWNDPTPDALSAQRGEPHAAAAACAVMVPDGTDRADLERLQASMAEQTYDNWHAYLVCEPAGEALCRAAASRDPSKYTVVVVPQEQDAVPALLGAAAEDALIFAAPTDVFAPHAVYEYMHALEAGADFVYSDEDAVDATSGQRRDPFFKPDYSPNLLLSYNYIGDSFAMRRVLAEQLRGQGTYDLVLQATDAAEDIRHIPDVLVHARREGMWFFLQPGDRAAVQRSLERRDISAVVRLQANAGHFDVDYALPDVLPSISILIPSHNASDMLRECVSSILSKTTYPNYEIVIIENNSTEQAAFDYYEEIRQDPRVRVLTWNHPFNFAAINNWAVQQTSSDLLLFLNNDTTVITEDWLGRMAALCARPDVGAVGAKLLYPDDTVQHGGVVMRMMGIAGHAHLGARASSAGSFWRLEVPFDVSGATGACLMIPREVFDEVGGFDEQYVLAFNDVDICLKIREIGLSILFEPRAELYHYESKTRGYEITPEQQKRFRNEQIIWIRKWLDKYPGDPFYNPNLRYDTCAFDTAPERRGASMRRMTKPYDDLIDAQIEPL